MKIKNNSNKVPFFLPYVDSKDITAIKMAASSIFLTNGPKLDAFEQKFKKFTKSKFAIGVSNATAALYLSLKALGIKKNEDPLISGNIVAGNPKIVYALQKVLAT